MQKRESGCGLWGKIPVKLGPLFWKKSKETGILIGSFSYFAWGIYLIAGSSGFRNTWVEIEGQNS